MCFSTKVKTDTPPAPTAPTAASSIRDYVELAPQLLELQKQQNPQLAEMDYQLAQEYAPKYQQLMMDTEAQAYPYTAGLQEQLAKRASEGIGGELTPELEASYRNRLRAEIGPNAGSGIGADYVSRGLIDAEQQYQRYYDDLGLSLTGRLPLSQATNPSFRTSSSLLDPSSVMGFNQGVYGTQGSIFSNLYNTNVASAANARNQNMQLLGGLIGAGSSFFGGR